MKAADIRTKYQSLLDEAYAYIKNFNKQQKIIVNNREWLVTWGYEIGHETELDIFVNAESSNTRISGLFLIKEKELLENIDPNLLEIQKLVFKGTRKLYAWEKDEIDFPETLTELFS